jgi:hypothetical protein
MGMKIGLGLLMFAAAVTATSRAKTDVPIAAPGVHEAFEKLRAAACFESTHIGYGGDLSEYVSAFRVLHAQPEAATLFRDLYEHATAAGQLYALSGLYFAEPARFADDVERLRARHGEQQVCVRMGCIRSVESVAEVLRATGRRRIRVARGQTLSEWLTTNEPSVDDIAGGGWPLSFVEEGARAPTDPL